MENYSYNLETLKQSNLFNLFDGSMQHHDGHHNNVPQGLVGPGVEEFVDHEFEQGEIKGFLISADVPAANENVDMPSEISVNFTKYEENIETSSCVGRSRWGQWKSNVQQQRSYKLMLPKRRRFDYTPLRMRYEQRAGQHRQTTEISSR